MRKKNGHILFPNSDADPFQVNIVYKNEEHKSWAVCCGNQYEVVGHSSRRSATVGTEWGMEKMRKELYLLSSTVHLGEFLAWVIQFSR